jgi:hypothetical protein
VCLRVICVYVGDAVCTLDTLLSPRRDPNLDALLSPRVDGDANEARAWASTTVRGASASRSGALMGSSRSTRFDSVETTFKPTATQSSTATTAGTSTSILSTPSNRPALPTKTGEDSQRAASLSSRSWTTTSRGASNSYADLPPEVRALFLACKQVREIVLASTQC